MGRKKNNIVKNFFVIFFIIFFFLPQNLSAFGLHTLSDKMSRHAPLTPSDHEIKFTTPSGIGSAGQYLRLSFDSGFDLSNIDYTDIDLSHGPITGNEINEPLSLAPTNIAWGVNVSGSQIDFWHPTNDANGDILPNDIVIIKIGLNAFGGNRQIINPATVGSKIIRIEGNFGDVGSLAVPIFQDQIIVQGQPPATPPTAVILNQPFNITASSMELSWSINYDFDFSRYELYMSLFPDVNNTTGNLLATFYDRNQINHVASGLATNTRYYFKLYVYDTQGLFTPSNEVSEITLSGGGSTTPPVVPLAPTVYERYCPIFVSPFNLAGTREAGSVVFVNGSTEGVIYPNETSWSKLINLNLGPNQFTLYARNSSGQNSNIVSVTINRWRVGDVNGDFKVNDFDLSGLAAHFWSDWCFSDFNEDAFVDDFDLSGLAANWDNVY